VIWRATIGAAVSDWDVGAGGLIYVLGADNKLYAITAQGQVKWITRLRGKYPGSVVEVREGTVYAVSGWDFPATRHAYVEAVSPDGGVRWTRDMGCLDRVVAVRSDGSVLVGCSEGSFYCLSPDGEIKWKIPAEGRGEGWWGQPVTAADGTMYLPGRNRLYAVTSAGEVKWERDFGGASPSAFTSAWRETFRNRSERSKRDVPGTPTPLIGPDGTVYVCAGHRVCALTPSGELKWKIETAEETETPLIGADGMLYVCAYNTVYALTIDGREKWHLCPQEREWVRVLHTAADGTVYLRSWTGRGVWIGSIDAGDMAQAGEKAEEQGRRGPGATTTPEAPGQGR
jgi:outer membrane protein assembly factor BamB